MLSEYADGHTVSLVSKVYAFVNTKNIMNSFTSSDYLKVHKIEIFFGFDLKFVLFLYYLCENIKI